MEFVCSMQTVFLAYFPEVIVIFRVLPFPVHNHLYGTSNVVAVFSSFILYKSLDWHNHKADSGYLRLTERLRGGIRWHTEHDREGNHGHPLNSGASNGCSIVSISAGLPAFGIFIQARDSIKIRYNSCEDCCN